MTKDEILHICVQIVEAERTLNAAVDKLLQAVGITREEATSNE